MVLNILNYAKFILQLICAEYLAVYFYLFNKFAFVKQINI